MKEKQFNLIDIATIQDTQKYIQDVLNKILKNSNLPVAIFATSDDCEKVLNKIYNYSGNLRSNVEKDKTNLEAEATYIYCQNNFSIEEIISKCLEIAESEYRLEYLFIDNFSNITIKKRKFNKENKVPIYIANKLAQLSDKLGTTVIVLDKK